MQMRALVVYGAHDTTFHAAARHLTAHLANERSGLAGASDAVSGLAGGRRRGLLDRRIRDPASGGRSRASGGTSRVFATRGFDLLRAAASANGSATKPTIRRGLASLYTLEQIARHTALRTKTGASLGRMLGPEASTMKLALSRRVRLARDLGMAIVGAAGFVAHHLDLPRDPGTACQRGSRGGVIRRG